MIIIIIFLSQLYLLRFNCDNGVFILPSLVLRAHNCHFWFEKKAFLASVLLSLQQLFRQDTRINYSLIILKIQAEHKLWLHTAASWIINGEHSYSETQFLCSLPSELINVKSKISWSEQSPYNVVDVSFNDKILNMRNLISVWQGNERTNEWQNHRKLPIRWMDGIVISSCMLGKLYTYSLMLHFASIYGIFIYRNESVRVSSHNTP